MRFVAVVLFLLAIPCAGQSRVELSTNPAMKEIWTGQKVPLYVELLAPGYFAGVPFFTLPKVPGVLLVPPQGSPVVGSRDIDGVNFTVQRHELAVVPARGGAVEIPAFDIRFSYKRQPLDKDPVEETVRTAAVTLTVEQPPGTSPGDMAIASADLEVTEAWTPEPGNSAHAGDAFVRTIQWSASDVPAMAFPPFDAGKIGGLGIYLGSPVVSEESERGVMRSQRVDTVTYVCKTGGDFAIPAVSFRWWDPVKRELRHVDFPERRFHVPDPPIPPESAREKAARLWHRYGMGLLAVSAAVAALAVSARLALPWWKRFFQRLLPRHLAPLNPVTAGTGSSATTP